MSALNKQAADAGPPQITPKQEQELGEFFCSQNTSACRSNFGAMIERLDMFGQSAELCDADGCEGGIDLQTGQLCKVCDGSGHQKPEKIPKERSGGGEEIRSTAQCPRCAGRTRRRCKICDGSGYVSAPLDVHPAETSSSHYEPNIVAMQAAGRILAGLDDIRAVDEQLAVALELYYGPIGNRWGAQDIGRAFAVWPITPSGRRLVEESRERSESAHTLEIAAHDLLFEEHEAERRASHPNPHRKSLLDSADKQAQALVDRARASWALLQRDARAA